MKHMDLRQVPAQMKKKVDETHDDIDVATGSNNLVRKLHVLPRNMVLWLAIIGEIGQENWRGNWTSLFGYWPCWHQNELVLKVLGCHGWILKATFCKTDGVVLAIPPAKKMNSPWVLPSVVQIFCRVIILKCQTFGHSLDIS